MLLRRAFRWGLPLLIFTFALGAFVHAEGGGGSVGYFIRIWRDVKRTGTFDARIDSNADGRIDRQDAVAAVETRLVGDQSTALTTTSANLASALQSGDATTAATFFVPTVQAGYRAAFQAHPEKMADLATALSTMRILKLENVEYSQTSSELIAWVEITSGGIKYHAKMVNINGVWKFKVL